MMIRKLIAAGTSVLVSTLVLGCASTPSAEAPAAAAASSATESTATEPTAATGEEPKVVLTTAQAKKYASEEELRRAYRECMRKMRRVTGSRIPRNACQGSAGMYSGAWNQRQEGSGQVGGGGLPQE